MYSLINFVAIVLFRLPLSRTLAHLLHRFKTGQQYSRSVVNRIVYIIESEE